MSILSTPNLKSLWQTGYQPTQSDYADLFDSLINRTTDKQLLGLHSLAQHPIESGRVFVHTRNLAGIGGVWTGTFELWMCHQNPPSGFVFVDPAGFPQYFKMCTALVDDRLNMVKRPVRAIVQNSEAISGLYTTADGVALQTDDRVLVNKDSPATTNGIYNAKAGAWERCEDMPTIINTAGVMVMVREGTSYNRKYMVCVDDPANSVGQTWDPLVP